MLNRRPALYGLLAAVSALLGASAVGAPVPPMYQRQRSTRFGGEHWRGYQPLSAKNRRLALKRERTRKKMRKASQRRNRS